MVTESRVTWATSVPILVFLVLSILELSPMYATDVRQTDVRQKHRLMPPPYSGGGITKEALKVERHHESCEQCRGYRANVRKVTSSS